MHGHDRQEARHAAQAEMAAHRRLFPPTGRHAYRRVLAGRKAAGRRLGARSRRQHLSGAWIASAPVSVARSPLTSRAGSAERITPPMAAIPAAPAAISSATRAAL